MASSTSSYMSDMTDFVTDSLSTMDYNNGTTESPPAPAPVLPMYTCMVFMAVTNGVGQCGLWVCSLLGNILCFVTWGRIGRNKGYNSSTVLMQSLAVSDFLTQTPLLFIWALPNVLAYTGNAQNPFMVATSPYNAKFGWPVASMGNFDTTIFTTLITVHRFCILSNPFGSFTRKLTSVTSTVLQVAAVYFIGACYQIPRIMGKDIITVTLDNGETIRVAVSSYLEKRLDFQLWYFTISYIVLANVGPLVISTFFTIRILMVLSKAKEIRKNMAGDAAADSGKEAAITAMLLTVVIMFIICQIPNTVVRVYIAFRPNTRIICGSPIFYLYSIAVLCISVNSSINIFIYASSQEFRNNLKQMFCGAPSAKDLNKSMMTMSSMADSASATSVSKVNVAVVDSPI